MKTELLFKNLFAKALEDWFKEINSNTKEVSGLEESNINDLYNFAEKIENRYINNDNEIIMRSLHSCIYGMLKDTKGKSIKADLKNLNSEMAQKIFEKNIKEGLEDGLNWSNQTITLIKSYFEANHPQN
ncbi:MAG: hypothetical protein KBD04_06460 [Proteobacteria bacterium]|nr:hypothetical protein [Pseudomonadota bacterium]